MNPPPPLFQLPPQTPQLFSMYTMSFIIAITLFLQGSLIGLSAYVIKSYKGIREASIATIATALGFLIILFSDNPPRPEASSLTNFLTICGYILFYLAICQFTKASKHQMIVVLGLLVNAIILLLVFLADIPLYYSLYFRLITGVVFNVLAGVRLLNDVRHREFNLSVYLTAVPLLLYALVLLIQIISRITTPGVMIPGTSDAEKFSNVALFVCSYIWSTGFILMIGQRLQSRLNELAMIDALTRVHNRRAMDHQLAFEMKQVHEEVRDFSIILLDIDYFKQVNDAYGHETGDIVLQWFAACLQNNVRAQDTVARWGGEEFLILLPDTPLGEAEATAERLRSIVANADIPIPQGSIHITFSAGVSTSVTNRDVRHLCKVADDALYLAKINRNEVKTQEDVFISPMENEEDIP